MTPGPEECVITTFTGKRVRPLALEAGDVDIQDIAHSLAYTCRFNGHTSRFYSVAEHSVRVALGLARWGPGVQLQGLLHDASEAYIHDVVAPLKPFYTVAGRPFTEVEDEVLKTVFAALGAEWPLHDAVTAIDQTVLGIEFGELMPGRGTWPDEIRYRSADDALTLVFSTFLALYTELRKAAP